MTERTLRFRVPPTGCASSAPKGRWEKVPLAKQVPFGEKLVAERELKASPYTILYMKPSEEGSAKRMNSFCSMWKSFLSSSDTPKKDDMRESLGRFIIAAFSVASACKDESVATQMLSSLGSLGNFAPAEVFRKLVDLCTTREPGGASYVASSILIDSANLIPLLENGDTSVYSAIEYFAGQFEFDPKRAMATKMQTNPKFGGFLTMASSRILTDSGLASRFSCIVPDEFASTVAYGILFGTAFPQKERLAAMDKISKTFNEEGQLALFSRIYMLGRVLPTIEETKLPLGREEAKFCFAPVRKEGSLLGMVREDHLLIMIKQGRMLHPDMLARVRITNCAKRHLMGRNVFLPDLSGPTSRELH